MYFFGLFNGKPSRKLATAANKAARKHGATLTEHEEPNGARRGWFSCPNMGHPFDDQTRAAVLAEPAVAEMMEAL